jgi:prepilin-type processing-associated H-X9-DG protein
MALAADPVLEIEPDFWYRDDVGPPHPNYYGNPEGGNAAYLDTHVSWSNLDQMHANFTYKGVLGDGRRDFYWAGEPR